MEINQFMDSAKTILNDSLNFNFRELLCLLKLLHFERSFCKSLKSFAFQDSSQSLDCNIHMDPSDGDKRISMVLH